MGFEIWTEVLFADFESLISNVMHTCVFFFFADVDLDVDVSNETHVTNDKLLILIFVSKLTKGPI
jgi:hypothetical protein